MGGTLERDYLLNRSNHIIKEYFRTLKIDINKNGLENSSLAPATLIVSENYEFIEDEDCWNSIIYRLVLQIKMMLEKESFSANMNSFSGLPGIYLAINTLQEKTGMYTNFSEAVSKYYLDKVEQYLLFVKFNMNNLKLNHYDLVGGITGIGNAILLKKNKTQREEQILLSILDYLKVLSWLQIIENNTLVPRFYIKAENQMREDERKKYIYGNLNFGLAHGMMGPLLLLAKSYKKDYRVLGQLEAIHNLIGIYKEFFYRDSAGILLWPTQLPLEDYDSKERIIYKRRASWCYGTAGLSRSMYQIGKYLNNEELKMVGFKSLLSISKAEKENSSLTSPIVCHGYAGLLKILLLTMWEEPECEELIKPTIIVLIKKIIGSYNMKSRYGFINIDYKILPNNKFKMTYNDSLDYLEGSTGIVDSLIAFRKKESSIFCEQLMIK